MKSFFKHLSLSYEGKILSSAHYLDKRINSCINVDDDEGPETARRILKRSFVHSLKHWVQHLTAQQIDFYENSQNLFYILYQQIFLKYCKRKKILNFKGDNDDSNDAIDSNGKRKPVYMTYYQNRSSVQCKCIYFSGHLFLSEILYVIWWPTKKKLQRVPAIFFFSVRMRLHDFIIFFAWFVLHFF